MSYEGWVNWETWNMALWIDNEYYIYLDRIDQQDEHGRWTAKTAREFCLNHFPNGTQDMESPGELSNIKWQQIADNWNTEINEDDIDPDDEPEDLEHAIAILDAHDFEPTEDETKLQYCQYIIHLGQMPVFRVTTTHRDIGSFNYLQDAIAFCENV